MAARLIRAARDNGRGGYRAPVTLTGSASDQVDFNLATQASCFIVPKLPAGVLGPGI